MTAIDPVLLMDGFLVALLAYLVYLMPDLMPESVQFGVRLPPDHQHDPLLPEVRRAYRRQAVLFAVLAAALLVPLLFLPASASVELASLFSLLVIGGGGFGAYLVGRGKVLRAKEAGAWTRGVRQVAVAPLASTPALGGGSLALWAAPMVAVWALFLVLAVLAYPSLPSSLPTHFSASGAPDAYAPKSWGVVLLVPVLGAFLLALFGGIAAAVARTRSETDPARAHEDARRQRIFRSRMARTLLLMGTCVEATLGLSSLPILGLVAFSPALFGLSLLPMMLAVVVVAAVSVHTGQLGARVPAEPGASPRRSAPGPGAPMARDDDRFWKAGAIYYNPEDSSVLVAKRFGVGWTMNFAHPVTWAFLAAIVVMPVALVLFLG